MLASANALSSWPNHGQRGAPSIVLVNYRAARGVLCGGLPQGLGGASVIRAARLLLYFVVGVLLSSVVVISHAETIPAELQQEPTQSRAPYQYNGQNFTTAQLACQAWTSYPVIANPASVPNYWNCDIQLPGWGTFGNNRVTGTMGCQAGWSQAGSVGCQKMGCPANQNWTLSGSTCTRPDCVAPETRDEATGLCKPADCPAYSVPATDSLTQNPPAGCQCPSGSKWYPFNGCRKTCLWQANERLNAGWDFEYKAGVNSCVQGCEAQGDGPYLTGKDGMRVGPMASSGWACGAGAPDSPVPPDDPLKKMTDDKKHPPICGEGEGVMTSSSGNVLCLPSGIPSASKPVVDKKTKSETFPDNSVKTTETTKTTDPNTKATHTTTTTTSSGGMAGPSGDTKSEENESSGEGDGDCAGEECGEGGGGEFPGNGELWEIKYPEGLAGVLDAKFAEIKNTELFGLVNQLVPTSLPDGGSCPQYSFSMNMGSGMNFGSSSIEMPCIVWDFVRIVMLIGASLLARRLIFGG